MNTENETNEVEETEETKNARETIEENYDYDSANRIMALATFLEVDPLSIEQCKYDDCAFEVSPRKVKHGDSPDKIAEKIKTTKEALGDLTLNVPLPGDNVSEMVPMLAKEIRTDYWNERLYRQAQEYLQENNPESLKAGLHDVLNTLYFLYCAPDKYDRPDTRFHRETIRAIWNGKRPEEIQDTRELNHANSGEYLVLTDSEADEKFDQAIDSYIEECMEIPSNLEMYVDKDRMRNDMKRDSSRGNELGRYDSNENEQEYNDETYYIYRTN